MEEESSHVLQIMYILAYIKTATEVSTQIMNTHPVPSYVQAPNGDEAPKCSAHIQQLILTKTHGQAPGSVRTLYSCL